MNYYNKNESYFVNYISSQNDRIEHFNKLSCKCVDESAKIRLNQTLYEMNKNIILAKCSLGYSKDKIEFDVKCFMDSVTIIQDRLPISEKINVLCIRYLFKIGISNALQFLPQLKELLSESDSQVYQKFSQILSSDNVEDELKKFMNNDWYNLCSDFSWYGTENSNTFVGYWSFVAAAIAKAKIINNTSIEFMPYNLL